MVNSYFTNNHTRKIITENVIFHDLYMSKYVQSKNNNNSNLKRTCPSAHPVEKVFSSQETQLEYNFHHYHFLNDISFLSFFIIFFNLNDHSLNAI